MNRQSPLSAAISTAVAIFIAVAAARIDSKSAKARASHDRQAALPKIFLWAWERPEALDFINAREVGVAFLAETIFLRSDETLSRPRFQPLSFPEGTALIAVVRIESDRREPPSLSAMQREKAVAAIAALAQNPSLKGVQIDFDATASERAFYKELIVDLRGRLPNPLALSITALASWCIHDDWISDLPIDEATPMLFRMGPDAREINMRLKSGEDFRSRVCRRSVGISTDEPIERLPSGRRIYIFHPRSWTQEAEQNILREVRKWR